MIQGQCDPPSPIGRQHFLAAHRAPALQRHPVMTPVLLLCGATVLGIASFFADSLFPLLAFLGLPPVTLCLVFAFVLGIAGILASIVSLIERFDRSHTRHAGMFPHPKEGTVV